jgi:hypothetical protein
MAAPDNRNIIGEYITKVKWEVGADYADTEKSNYKGHRGTQRKTAGGL